MFCVLINIVKNIEFYGFSKETPKQCFVKKNAQCNVKNIANLHRQHNVLIFFKHHQKH